MQIGIATAFFATGVLISCAAKKSTPVDERVVELTDEQKHNMAEIDRGHYQLSSQARVIGNALLAMLKFRNQYHSPVFDQTIHELTRLGCRNEQNDSLAAVIVAAPIDEAFPLEFIAEATGAWCGVLFLPNQREENSKLRLREEAKASAKPTF